MQLDNGKNVYQSKLNKLQFSSSGMKSTFFQSCQTLRNEILKIVKTTLKAQVNIYQFSNWLKQDKKLLGLRLGDSRD